MKKENLKKANELIEEIEHAEESLRIAQWTQTENVLERVSRLSIGSGADIDVPKSLFKVIGKLILSEYVLRLAELQKEFDEL